MVQLPNQDPEALNYLRTVPFVNGLHYSPALDRPDLESDGEIEIQTRRRPFHLMVKVQRSYLTSSAFSQMLARLNHIRTTGEARGIILLARHVPRRAAEALIASDVNFAD